MLSKQLIKWAPGALCGIYGYKSICKDLYTHPDSLRFNKIEKADAAPSLFIHDHMFIRKKQTTIANYARMVKHYKSEMYKRQLNMAIGHMHRRGGVYEALFWVLHKPSLSLRDWVDTMCYLVASWGTYVQEGTTPTSQLQESPNKSLETTTTSSSAASHSALRAEDKQHQMTEHNPGPGSENSPKACVGTDKAFISD